MNKKIVLAVVFVSLLSIAFVVYPASKDNKYHRRQDIQTVKTELYFGLSRNDSGEVMHHEWQAFEDTVITLAFPNGSTTHETKGKWRNEYGIVISEKSKVVVLVNEMTPDISAQIDSVREKYKRYHHQTAVLRVDHQVEISF